MGEMEVYLHAFLISVLGGREYFASHPSNIAPEEEESLVPTE
jgi:hypothetical protein